ncbi:MAG TPA: hypothetical protein VNV65_00565 [Candidatus Solibacter sp.]|nr:hypothetical protein [Candidatus Solibacter sp.]
MLLVAYLLSGPLISGWEAGNQTDALNATGRDMTKIDAFLSETIVRDSKKTDAVAFKAAVDVYAAKLTDTDATLAADQDRLDRLNRDIDFYGIFTPFESGKAHANDATIRHAKLALDAVAKAVAIDRTELSFYSAFIAAEVDSEAADKAVTAKDLTAASLNYQKAVNDLDQCKVLSSDSDIAPQFLPVIVALGKLMTDVAGMADTARANDPVGYLGYVQRLIQDSTVITFDQQAYLTWYSQKFDPLERAFRANAVAVPRYTVTTTTLV